MLCAALALVVSLQPPAAPAGAAAHRGPQHWAFRAPERPPLPALEDDSGVRNPIDRFVRARLEQVGWKPAPEADPAVLVRRLHLDLTGLPPTLEELDRYLADPWPDRYERRVDELLESPHYGEHMARTWLDLARYADTNGFEKDRPRSMWPWRDWVIDAFNRDLPFDRFTVLQLAGDLVENASRSDRIATGFHRNTMLNEEGGIDVEEYRFYSVVDRTNTTAATWLGLTLGCAQCHDHKYDPLPQEDYYRFLAFFDNTDEPVLEVPDPAITAARAAAEKRIRALEAGLADRFPAPLAVDWEPLHFTALRSEQGAALRVEDDTVVAAGPAPERDVYRLAAEVPAGPFVALRLEALVDPHDASVGPGRTPHGNFVLSELELRTAATAGEPLQPVALRDARADFSQQGYPVPATIDGDPKAGWAVHDPTRDAHRDRAATFATAAPVVLGRGARVELRLQQGFGDRHTLGRFRLAIGRPRAGAASEAERRHAQLAARRDEWARSVARRAHRWRPLRPARAVSEKRASMDVQADASVLVSGDAPQTDVYEVEAPCGASRVTGLRLEALTDDSLPEGGPGRAIIFKPGDFMLSEVELYATAGGGERRIALARASHDYAHTNSGSQQTLDGQLETGWSIEGRTGEPHEAVFELAEPLRCTPDTRLRVVLRQHGIHQMTLGRFRLSVTADPGPIDAAGVPAGIEAILLRPAAERGHDERAAVRAHFLRVAPELAAARAEIAELLHSMPAQPTTLVLRERPAAHARTTHIHQRGEFLRTRRAVTPGTPAVLPPLPPGPRNRLTLARWLVDPHNPLVARVTVNRLWQGVFGRGLVATPEDFGSRGDRPTHPALLDWLATELVRRHWSLKQMMRLIVTSATYRQSSAAAPEQWRADPHDELLARGPRVRVAAEIVRDIALVASGLLAPRVGGPSVFPPQPPGVTSLSYGSLAWTTSEGEDRYRRGLYTFLKRTAPYAAFATFDAPSRESCCPRRRRSNTPLQSLVLLNDTVFVEAARALARRAVGAAASDGERLELMFRACTSRPPDAGERRELLAFVSAQRARLQRAELDARALAGPDQHGADRVAVATWTALARVLLNLDETITKS